MTLISRSCVNMSGSSGCRRTSRSFETTRPAHCPRMLWPSRPGSYCAPSCCRYRAGATLRLTSGCCIAGMANRRGKSHRPALAKPDGISIGHGLVGASTTARIGPPQGGKPAFGQHKHASVSYHKRTGAKCRRERFARTRHGCPRSADAACLLRVQMMMRTHRISSTRRTSGCYCSA